VLALPRRNAHTLTSSQYWKVLFIAALFYAIPSFQFQIMLYLDGRENSTDVQRGELFWYVCVLAFSVKRTLEG
jgi:hypothetical protein